MAWRSKPGGRPVQARGRKKPPAKRRSAARATGYRNAVAGEPTRVARLRRELNEARDQQAATGEVLKILSGSTYNLQSVLDKLVELALHLCEADAANIWLPKGGVLALAASSGHSSEFKRYAARHPITPDRGTVSGRVFLKGRTVHIPDVLADREFTGVGYQSRGNYRCHLGVPMLRKGRAIGVIALTRKKVTPYSKKQIELVETFANQAVIAMENKRLLETEKHRSRELAKSLHLLQRERSNKIMNLEAMAASIGHEVKQPLAAIASNSGAALRFLARDPPVVAEAESALTKIITDSHRAGAIFDNIRALFGKDDHEREPIDLGKLALEALEALRDELRESGVTIRAELTAAPSIAGHRGQLQEVFINLIQNAIEAMRAVEADRRLLQVRTEARGGHAVAIAIEDSGTGIDPKQAQAIFDAFVTTKPKGMGLGLAICRMIIERHGGQLSVSPARPRGSIFTVVLPV